MAESGASVTVTIRLSTDSKSLSGVFVTAEGETRFAGWMELAALLESARADAPE
jgi:hypothetical protein